MQKQRLRQFGIETAIYAAVLIVVRLLAMIAIAVYARWLLPDELGLLDISLAVQALLLALGALGLRAAIKLFWFEDADPRAANTTALVAQSVAASTLAVGGMILAPAMSAILLGGEARFVVFVLASATVPFILMQDYTAGMLRVVQRPWSFALVVVGTAALQAGLGIWLVAGQGLGAEGILLGGLAAQIATALAGLWLIRRTLSRRFSAVSLRSMLVYGVPLVPVDLLRWTTANVSRIFFGFYGLLAAAGVFGIGFRIGVLVLVATQAFELSWVPFALSVGQQQDAPALYARGALMYALLVGTITGAVGLFAGELTTILAAPAYAEAAALVPLIGLAHAAGGSVTVLGISALVTRRTGRLSAAVAVGAATTLLLTIPGIGAFGAAGAAWSLLAGQVVGAALLVALTRGLLPVPYNWRILGLIVILTAGLCLLGAVWPAMPILVSVALKGAILILGLLGLGRATGIVGREDLRRLLRRLVSQ